MRLCLTATLLQKPSSSREDEKRNPLQLSSSGTVRSSSTASSLFRIRTWDNNLKGIRERERERLSQLLWSSSVRISRGQLRRKRCNCRILFYFSVWFFQMWCHVMWWRVYRVFFWPTELKSVVVVVQSNKSEDGAMVWRRLLTHAIGERHCASVWGRKASEEEEGDEREKSRHNWRTI